ncbi:hypothetical protein HYQ45_011905 [Verticillium longisporum]|uniref:T6SS Phospholipase effector Tle1-like catalytic domain-containing protein n=1 Tax=Verticillium longisporum TaxID=100787 RepID=A0A8I2ZFM3_VERLO|nr:hypothetical protein HYQ45_011905 [Verticillium longisporum]
MAHANTMHRPGGSLGDKHMHGPALAKTYIEIKPPHISASPSNPPDNDTTGIMAPSTKRSRPEIVPNPSTERAQPVTAPLPPLSSKTVPSSKAAPAPSGAPKRLIITCDGTWMDSLGEKGGDPQSNVTRISRVLRRTCQNGMHQIIAYNPGVGSGNALDRVTGGMLGVGLEQAIREVYNFICTNYVDGDEIVLVGFSRGAFTARSVADMVASIGLLTPAGLDYFFAIFDDYEHMGSSKRAQEDFLCDDLPPYAGQLGEDKLRWEAHRKDIYRRWLKTLGYTRDTHADGRTLITIKALGVWDTVGTLGVPPVPIIDTWKFTNTEVSDRVENAFQALALDEPRFAFRPALWERVRENRTNLKQVWFPGNHGGVGGGWHDQQIATISLAWMCDQLSTVGIEFSLPRMTEVFLEGLRYNAAHPFPVVGTTSPLPAWASFLWQQQPKLLPWGSPDICRATHIVRDETEHDDATCKHPRARPEQYWQTARSWALGQIRAPTSRLQMMAGETVRNPGLFMRADCDTNKDTDQPLLNTNERIHSSVRVRLACEGLGLDDGETWRCRSLSGGSRSGRQIWRLAHGSAFRPAAVDALRMFRPREVELGYPAEYLYPVDERDGQWQWVFDQEGDITGAGHERVPQALVLPEEPMIGYWEKYLLALTSGYPDVWRYAEKHPPFAYN